MLSDSTCRSLSWNAVDPLTYKGLAVLNAWPSDTLDGNGGKLTGWYGGPSVFRQVTFAQRGFWRTDGHEVPSTSIWVAWVFPWPHCGELVRVQLEQSTLWNAYFWVVVLEILTAHQGVHSLIFLGNEEQHCHQDIVVTDGQVGEMACCVSWRSGPGCSNADWR